MRLYVRHFSGNKTSPTGLLPVKRRQTQIGFASYVWDLFVNKRIALRSQAEKQQLTSVNVEEFTQTVHIHTIQKHTKVVKTCQRKNPQKNGQVKKKKLLSVAML